MKEQQKKFNIRAYGIWVNDKNEVLLSFEHKPTINFTKFPGGGLEWGESIKDCLLREFKEELGVEVDLQKHFYTTDFFKYQLSIQMIN